MRQHETYKQWTAHEAGIMEDVRRHSIARQQIAIIQEGGMDEVETGVRMIYPVLACVTPALSFDDFIDLEAKDADMLIHLAVKLNPSWDTTGLLTAEEKKSNPPSGMQDLPQTTSAAKKRRHSPKK